MLESDVYARSDPVQQVWTLGNNLCEQECYNWVFRWFQLGRMGSDIALQIVVCKVVKIRCFNGVDLSQCVWTL